MSFARVLLLVLLCGQNLLSGSFFSNITSFIITGSEFMLLLPPYLLFKNIKSLCKKEAEDFSKINLLESDQAIVLLHGRVVNKDSLYFLEMYLKNNVDAPVVSFDVMEPEDNIVELSNILLKKLDNFKEKSGIDKYILIGHSLGGIIAAYLEKQMTQKELQIIKVITIASPLYGMPDVLEKIIDNSCGLLYKESYEQFRSSSSIIQDIKKHVNNSSKYYHILGSWDFIVPLENNMLGKKDDSRIYISNFCGHCSMLINPKIFKVIEQMIKSESDK